MTKERNRNERKTLNENKEKRKITKTRVTEKLLKIKEMLHARTLIKLSEVDALVDACVADLLPNKKPRL